MTGLVLVILLTLGLALYDYKYLKKKRIKTMKFIDFSKFKKWAYEIPTYEQPFWNKVDEVLNSSMEKAFANPIVAKGAEKIEQAIQSAEDLAEKHFTKPTKDNNEKDSN